MLIPVMILAMAAGPEPEPVVDLLGTAAAPQWNKSHFRRDWDAFAFDESELTLRAGMLWYSDDFEADPEPCGGLLYELPMPWLGRGIFGLPFDAMGLFTAVTVSQIDRDITPPLKDPDGTPVFVDLGLNLSLIETETWMTRLYGGCQYGHYGGVTDMRNGSAGILGAGAGVNLTNGLRVTWTGEVSFGHDGDLLLFNFLGLQIEF